MGLANNSSNVKYVRLTKQGKFALNTDLETPYDELEGTLTGLRFKDDTYEGNLIRKCNIGLTDTEGVTYVVGVSVDSSWFSTFVSFLKNADLAQPITIHPKINPYDKADGTKGERRSLLISQDGTFLKSFYSKDSGNKLPEFKKVVVNKKTVYDKGDFLTELERIVTEDFIPQLPKQPVVKFKAESKTANTDTVEPTVTTEGDETLPWDQD